MNLHHESIEDALRTVVAASGGWKRVGAQLRPEWEEKPEQAARWLQDCLNPDRAEKLSFDQFFQLLRLGRRANCHAAMNQITEEAGYMETRPVDPQSELNELYREFNASVERLEKIEDRIRRTADGMRQQPRAVNE